MSDTIPPLLSNSPPPPPSPDDEEDDEFGNFTVSNDFSFTCDGFISSPSPSQSPNMEKGKPTTNITDETENDEIKSIIKDMDINHKVSSDNHFSTRLKDDVNCHSNSLSMKVDDGNDILRIISGQFDKLGFNYSDIEEQKCTILKNHHDDECSLTNSEDIEDTVLTNGFIQNDDLISIQTEEKNCNLDSTEESIAQLKDDGTDCIANSSYFNGSNKVNGDFVIEDTETATNIEKGNEKIEIFADEKILKTNNESAKSEGTHLQTGAEQLFVIAEDVQANLTENESISNSIDTFKEEIEDNVSDAGISSHETSFEDSSSISQDILDNRISSPKSYLGNDNRTHDVYETTEQEIPNELEDFGDFTAFSSEQQNIVNSGIIDEHADMTATQTSNSLVFVPQEPEETNDAFANFHASNSNFISDEADNDDEFSSFATFESPNIPKTMHNQPKDDDDDFGVFSSATFVPQQYPCQPSTSKKYSEIDEMTLSEPIFLSLSEKEAFEKSKQIIQEMYPSFEEVLKDCEFVSPEDDAIFKQLKDVTDTPALSYHWSKSTTQKCLLRALNIDVRNMMFGPTWNPTIPRFAAHVGLQPLEPVKADLPPLTSIKLGPSISQAPDVHNVQFDWTSSGLVNPLDFSVDAKGSQLPDISTQQIPEISLVPDPEIPTSSKTIEFPDNNDFREFESYQPPAASMEWRNILPLRETHISNISSEPNIQSNIEAWLQPTIVTPELTRRTFSVDESTSTIIIPEVMKGDDSVQESDDEFDDFQMVLPEKDSNQTTGYDTYGVITNTPMLDTLGLNNIAQKNGLQDGELIDSEPLSKSTITDLSISSLHSCSSASSSLKDPNRMTNSSQDDDEFTDFHYSMPKLGHATSTILIPSTAPLEPTLVHPKAEHTQINWPDPGLSDEELRKFENVFSSPLNFKQEANRVSKSEDLPKKKNDNEEWTEFVSQKPSPVHKLKLNSSEREKTSSPDLTLSVFNLGNIQPTKPPVPIITPQGLVQTKLSTNTASSSPKAQSKNSVDTRSMYVGQQPSIISNQFASQAYNFSSLNYNNVKPAGPSQIRDIMINDTSQEEDEWGEFVSSPLPPKPAQNAWANQTPNIILNPGHFVQSASDIGKRVSNFSSASKKSTLPKLPELDFIAPKTRTIVARKK